VLVTVGVDLVLFGVLRRPVKVQKRQTNLLANKRGLQIDLLRNKRELLTPAYLRSASTPSPRAGRAVTFVCTWWIGSSRPTSSVSSFALKHVGLCCFYFGSPLTLMPTSGLEHLRSATLAFLMSNLRQVSV
jgi:hypothetical protein